ncbi:hypothetical protein Phi13:2_gp051 [Cellulophaga phage phi13:2]|uniref:Uncharacterized protein n=1 Tax=Cellulophaga phage phi13:2 TaxID=1328030 RepID=S0A2M9_9CAUD|nr:hypothetical protein Phi13:2_gp051 [Cellulophaga phage phi13:2]AGO49661.1 hypothetical protein Phi13:2_gp051 [Cellulophaga phage phi13:2]
MKTFKIEISNIDLCFITEYHTVIAENEEEARKKALNGESDLNDSNTDDYIELNPTSLKEALKLDQEIEFVTKKIESIEEVKSKEEILKDKLLLEKKELEIKLSRINILLETSNNKTTI